VTTELEQASQPPGGAIPAKRPALDEQGRPRWPVWFGPAGFLGGLLGTAIVFAIAGAISAATGHHLPTTGPGIELGGTLVQDSFFVLAAVVLASFIAPPKLWHFGIRSAPLGYTARQAAKALAAFYVFALVYTEVLHPHGQQSVAKDLGANNGGLDMVLGAILVVAIAPACEEFFFRGFFYRGLRSRFGIISAAVIDGLVFGAIHYTDPKTLSLLPILAVLGFLFCLLYERTGTLLATISLHAINNGIAYGSTVHGSGGIAAGLAIGVVAVCVLLVRRLGHPAPVAVSPAAG
jgi:CAAX protease family protein